jgi:hypothetical protein
MTSHLTPSAAPTNINELRAKTPEPTHPDRDPVRARLRGQTSNAGCVDTEVSEVLLK